MLGKDQAGRMALGEIVNGRLIPNDGTWVSAG